jgi:AcrR family transcriptional regulator
MGNAAGNATRERLILVAERLYAQRGLDGVSLREIGEEAGQRNTAVAHYYFGGRDGLMRAIFDYRTESITARVNELVGKALTTTEPGTPERLALLVEATLLPLYEQLGVGHYTGFVAKHLDHGFGWTYVPHEAMASNRRMQRLIYDELPQLSEEVFFNRFRMVTVFVVAELASRERDTELVYFPRLDDGEYLEELLATCLAMLQAPAHDRRLTSS